MYRVEIFGVMRTLKTLLTVRAGMEKATHAIMSSESRAELESEAKNIVAIEVYLAYSQDVYDRTFAILNAVEAKSEKGKGGAPCVAVFIKYIPSAWGKGAMKMFATKGDPAGTQAKYPGGRDDTYASFFLPQKSAKSFLGGAEMPMRDFFKVWCHALPALAKMRILAEIDGMFRMAGTK